jgi:hypothetical protein
MPFRNDPSGGGTNADGSISKTYCSYCYQKGRFTQPDITVKEMQSLVKDKLKQLGIFHRVFAGFFASGIPKLDRWNGKLKESTPIK